jgi:hypothetical protein
MLLTQDPANTEKIKGKKKQKKMLRRFLKSPVKKKFKFLRPFTQKNQTTNNKDDSEAFNVDDLFTKEKSKYSFPDPQIYFLSRDFVKLKSHAKRGYYLSFLNLSFGTFLFLKMNPYLGGALMLLSSFPLLRSRLMMHNVKPQKTLRLSLDSSSKRTWSESSLSTDRTTLNLAPKSRI